MTERREFKESPFTQGEDEQIAYVVTVPTSWGSSIFTSLSAALYEDPDGTNTDVTTTKLSGSTTTSGQVITTPIVKSLTAGTKYRLEVKFTTAAGNILECYAIIFAER